MKVQSINNASFMVSKGKKLNSQPSQKSSSVKKFDDESLTTKQVLLGILAIIGLTALLYVLPKNSTKDVIQKSTDSIVEKKSVINDTIKDTLNLFI